MSVANLNYKAIIKIMGIIILFLGLTMVIPLIYSIASVDSDATSAFGK